MIGCAAEIVEIKNSDFAARQRHITVGGEATDPVVNCWSGGRVIT